MSLDSGALTWIVVAIVAAIVEISIPHFGLIFVSVAAAMAALVSALGFGLVPQIAIFIVAILLTFTLLRPLFIKRLHGPGVPGRTESLLGRDGIVTEPIDPVSGTGRVNVGGQDWAARSPAGVAAGTVIKVIGADGIVLEVRPA
jgi:membrane protein implicated in regulation of membrane protease activity